jgi:hypothetical protein
MAPPEREMAPEMAGVFFTLNSFNKDEAPLA